MALFSEIIPYSSPLKKHDVTCKAILCSDLIISFAILLGLDIIGVFDFIQNLLSGIS